ncbi:MAG: hypothetical protein ABTQ25_09515 [Nitrosomonas ureae]
MITWLICGSCAAGVVLIALAALGAARISGDWSAAECAASAQLTDGNEALSC